MVWAWQLYVVGQPMNSEFTAVVVSLSGRRAARESLFGGAAHRRDAAPGSMSDILFLILRRLRAPLITVIVVYAISVGGLALIPGVTPKASAYR
jgi:hypothetical protein